MSTPSADLLTHVARDLTGCALARTSATTAVVTSEGGAAFEVEVRRERRRLLDLQTLVVHVIGPLAPTRDVAIVLRHRGQLRRRGLEAVVRGRERASGRGLRDRVLDGGDLEAASLRLDFTRFELRPHRGRWRASFELMGASHVRTTFPPTSRYVRLDDEQLRALLATIDVLRDRLPVSTDAPAGRERSRTVRDRPPAPGAPRAHLPGRPA